MKKTAKITLMLLLIVSLLTTVSFGTTMTKAIEVVYNSVNITVNGSKITAPNILYKGTTYVPLRAVSEALGKEVGWDQATKTASINDKSNSPTSPTATKPATVTPTEKNYVGHSNTKRFHYTTCGHGPKTEEVKVFFSTKDEAINSGFTPCGHCKP